MAIKSQALLAIFILTLLISSSISDAINIAEKESADNLMGENAVEGEESKHYNPGRWCCRWKLVWVPYYRGGHHSGGQHHGRKRYICVKWCHGYGPYGPHY